MTFSLLTTAALVTLATLGGSSADPYSWSYRPVFVFAPSHAHPNLQKQREINDAATAAMVERDIVVVTVVGDSVVADLGPPPGAEAGELRARFGVGDDAFAFILVGKDGGEKLRSDGPVPAERLAEVIDAMPMRQRERRERKQP